MTVIGSIFAILGIIAFLFSPKWLYRLLILSVPFSGTSVLNVGSSESGSGVQLWMYFGLLWILREMGAALLVPGRTFAKPILRRMKYVIFFTAVLGASILMPIYINGSLEINSPHLLDFTTKRLYFTSANLTAWLYVVFGTTLTFWVIHKNRNEEEMRNTERLYLISAVIAAILGISEFVAHMFSLPSPTLIFQNSISVGAGAYNEVFSSGVARVSSVANEPAILSQFLISVLPMSIPGLLNKGFLFSKRIDRLCFLIIVSVLLLSTSSAGYFMLIATPILCLPAIAKLGFKISRAVFYAAGFLLVLLFVGILIYFLSPMGSSLISEAVINKSDSFSALERAGSVAYSLGYFWQYPILGVGWGSVVCLDVFAKVLGSAGLVGFGSLVLMLFHAARPVYRRIGTATTALAAQSSARWWMSGTLLLVISSITGFPYYYGHMWVVLGMVIAAGFPERQRAPASATVQMNPVSAVNS